MLSLVVYFFSSGIGQALTIAAITAAVGRTLTARGKLAWAVSHQHFYRMPRFRDDGFFPVRTQQIWFQNLGRAPVEGIEIVLNWKPQHYEIWDPRKYEEVIMPDGRFALMVDSLSGRERFTLSMIDTINDLPGIMNVRTKSGEVRNLIMAPQRVWPNRILWLVAALLLIGITTGVYLALQWLIPSALAAFAKLPYPSSGL
ncbi:hypothetical protein ACHMW7_03835 [Aminobacter sp. UC22_36]|uniref:hypothetical protein n=1 Tax=Aminobacter sp. UC22_36 TaxID=3374549 RepID=UPI0037564E30